jgi:hypothetical protein
MMLLDNALFHPRDSILTSDDALNVVKFLPPTLMLLQSPWTKKLLCPK